MNIYGMNDITFEDDLKYVAERVSEALNIFNETVVSENKLVTMYGKDEFIALFITPYENKESWGQLRLRTKDMAATWENVPVGFSQINESRGLLADMRRSAHVSLKRNSVWYIDRQIKDVVGDRIVFTELTTNKGYLYKIAFTNGYVIYLSVTRDEKEYYNDHDVAQIYCISTAKKEPISANMTADECIMMLINIAMQSDMRVSEFISVAEQCGGRTTIANSYRTEDDSYDEAKAVFLNGYAMKLRIENGNMIIDIIGKCNGQLYLLDTKQFEKIEDICDVIRDISSLSAYVTQ